MAREPVITVEQHSGYIEIMADKYLICHIFDGKINGKNVFDHIIIADDKDNYIALVPGAVVIKND